MIDIRAMNLAAVDLNLLVTLEALLAERSVTRAARRLGLSQPALSHALQRLRDLFGDPLFLRAPGGLLPTDRALELSAPLAAALDAVRLALSGPAAFDPATARRTFAVATADHGSFVLLPELWATLNAEAPGVDVSVRVDTVDQGRRELLDGELDLLIGPYQREVAGYYRQRLLHERFVCVLRKGHPAARGGLTLDKWLALPHLLVAPRGKPGSAVDTALAAVGRARRVGLMVPQFLVAPHVVAGSDLVWTAPERMARAYAKLLPLVLRPVPIALEGFTVWQSWHERRHRDPGHAWLRARVHAVAAGTRRPGEPETGE
ncbi:MAG: LysR family transcriptional regulator [Myxococcaceae bacterium]|nr:LysR family transcriptional regulator [Myxococcaceae bacterium]